MKDAGLLATLVCDSCLTEVEASEVFYERGRPLCPTCAGFENPDHPVVGEILGRLEEFNAQLGSLLRALEEFNAAWGWIKNGRSQAQN